MSRANKYIVSLKTSLLVMLCLFSTFGMSVVEAGGSVSVRGYTRANGTYVAPHYRSAPDGVFGNNWSTLGNVNPYTGKPGTLTSPHTSGGTGYADPSTVDSGHVNQPSTATPQVQQLNSTRQNSLNGSLPEHAKVDYSGRNWECVKGYKRSGNGCSHVTIPANAKLDYLGHDWECSRGYSKSGNSCLSVGIPEHAKLDYFGHGWECEKGHRKSGNTCLSVKIPNNAKLDYFGHDWECEKGYRKSGDSCLSVKIPNNAKLDYFGHDWECEKGFRKNGDKCNAVQIPVNAKLDYFGHDWECEQGYRKNSGLCLPMNRP